MLLALRFYIHESMQILGRSAGRFHSRHGFKLVKLQKPTTFISTLHCTWLVMAQFYAYLIKPLCLTLELNNRYQYLQEGERIQIKTAWSRDCRFPFPGVQNFFFKNSSEKISELTQKSSTDAIGPKRRCMCSGVTPTKWTNQVSLTGILYLSLARYINKPEACTNQFILY